MNFGLTEEQQMVKDQVTKFAETQIKPIAADLDHTHRHPEEICRKLGAMGIMGVAAPTEYGGAGMDVVTYVLCMIAISKACASTGVIVSVNNSLYGFPVNAYGTHEQKLKFLAPVAGGEVEGCYALTEAGAGSDAAALSCKAELKGDKYIINGAKRFITSGNVAKYCVLACTTDVTKGYKSIINLIVDLKSTKGFSIGKIEEKIGILASGTAELVFEDAEVPAANLLGKEGQGFRQMLSGLDAGRIGIGSQACGIGKAALEDALNYAKERVQFGKPIASFQLTQARLVHMVTEITKAQLLCLQLGRLKDTGKARFQQISMAKRNNVFHALEIAREARGILGANGILEEYPVMRHAANLESVITYEGTHEMHTLIVGEDITGIPAYT